MRGSERLLSSGGRMRKTAIFAFCVVVVIVVARRGTGSSNKPDTVHADIIVSGIPGAGAIAQIGPLHRGSPFRDNAAFAAYTQPGQVLDRTRLLVASTSNFGAPLARPGEAAGSILSLDVSGNAFQVPPTFAAAGGQASG